ncbi:hypothetical protein BH18ACT15_BH18ACT15_11120 [soil metagenome]
MPAAGGGSAPSRGEDEAALQVKELAPGMRRLLWVAGALVFLAGVQLFVFTERTATHFAWTIDVPLTAAFLGAGYWASVAFEWLAARERVWANARIAVPTVFVFTTLTLVATFLHLDLFHLGSAFEPANQAVTWGWIAIYTFVPVAMVVIGARQRQVGGLDPPRGSGVPRWVAGVLVAQALVMLLAGAYLFLAPATAAALWPWPLTPLTGRAVGAWVFSLGLGAAHCLWANDPRRARPMAVGYVALGLLEAAAVARYPETVAWGEPQAIAYVGFLASFVVTGVALLWTEPRRGSA